MKRRALVSMMSAAAMLAFSRVAEAKLFVVEIDGEKLVLDLWVEDEQSWQYGQPGSPGWWDGLAPHPYGQKVWYPFLADTFDMTLSEQIAWIKDLDHGAIDRWRIAKYWDTTSLKASMFGGMTLGLPAPNRKPNFDSSVYFKPTACGPFFLGPICIYLGRVGNEDGLVTGAIVNPMEGFPALPNQRYVDDGVIARSGGMATVYYTLPRTEAQDHWATMLDDGTNLYNEDLNFNFDDTTVGLMSPVDYETGEQPIGAWAVSEQMPKFWPPIRSWFHSVSISDVVHAQIPAVIDPVTDDELEPARTIGALAAVRDVRVLQDEPVGMEPDARIHGSTEAAYIQLRADARRRGNGRVYTILFTDQYGDEYVFRVGVANWRRATPKDDGPEHDSTVPTCDRR